MQQQDLMTSGDIANHLKRPVGQVRYVLSKRADLRPCAKAGIIYLYRASILPDVEAACAAIRTAKRRIAVA